MILEKLFFFFSLLLFSKGLFPLLLENNDSVVDPLTGNRYLQYMYAVIFIISSVCIILSKKKSRIPNIIEKNIWYFLLLGLITSSILWSSYQQVTLRYVVSIIGTTIFSYHLYISFTKKELLKFLAVTFLVFSLFNVLLIVAKPDLGMMNDQATLGWRGIYQHKNRLGMMSVLSILTYQSFLYGERNNKFIWKFAVIINFILLVGSLSTSSYVSFIFIETIIYSKSILSKDNMRFIPIIIIFILIIVLTPILIFKSDQIADVVQTAMGYFGKDLTFTGRTLIWKKVVSFISIKPIIGYGVGGFWLGWEGLSGQIAKARGYSALNAHNGFLDILLDIGAIGLFLYILNTLSLIKNLSKNHSFLNQYFITFIIFLLFTNITESTLLERSSIVWILYTLPAFYKVNC